MKNFLIDVFNEIISLSQQNQKDDIKYVAMYASDNMIIDEDTQMYYDSLINIINICDKSGDMQHNINTIKNICLRNISYLNSSNYI